MKENILDYLSRTKDETIEMSPFNEVDSLILCQFSYLKFDSMVPGIGNRDNAVTLQDIASSDTYDNLYADERYRRENTALFEAMLASSRFNKIRLHSYVNIIEYDNETQFAALVIEFENGTTYVAFRGTDENLISWKEDLNLALAKPVPGQLRSVEYLDTVSDYISEIFYVGGHSKGGNLAVFSSMYCRLNVCNRIFAIYNHDGPGLRPELMNEERYNIIRCRIRMSVPQASLVGMLLVNHHNYRVVESKYIGLLQHDPFSWLVDGYEFKTTDEVKQASALRDKSINEWVLSLDDEQIQFFIDTVSEVVAASGAETLNDVIADWKNISRNIALAIKEVDEQTREVFSQIVILLVDMVEENAKSQLQSMLDDVKTEMSNLAATAKEGQEKLVATAKEGQEKLVATAKESQEKLVATAKESQEKLIEAAKEGQEKLIEAAKEGQEILAATAKEGQEIINTKISDMKKSSEKKNAIKAEKKAEKAEKKTEQKAKKAEKKTEQKTEKVKKNKAQKVE